MANQTVQQPVNPMRNRATASAHETVRPNRAVLELLVNGRTKYIKFLLSRLRDRDVAEERLVAVCGSCAESGWFHCTWWDFLSATD